MPARATSEGSHVLAKFIAVIVGAENRPVGHAPVSGRLRRLDPA